MAKKKASPVKSEKPEPVDFESALAEVERIVGSLESGELDLTEALRQYENGVRQLKHCHAILSEAERRVTLLSGFDAEGNPVTESMPETGPPQKRKRRKKGADPTLEGDSESGEHPDAQSSVDDSPGLF